MRLPRSSLLLSGTAAFIFCTLLTKPLPAADSRSDTVASTPPSLQAEHRDLHRALEALRHTGGKTAEAAAKVSEALQPHFQKEEKFALPPLGALQALSQGQDLPESSALITLGQQLERERTAMLAEHERIRQTLAQLRKAAQAENQPEGIEFAEKLSAHARMEEEVLYPAAILVGAYLQLRTKK